MSSPNAPHLCGDANRIRRWWLAADLVTTRLRALAVLGAAIWCLVACQGGSQTTSKLVGTWSDDQFKQVDVAIQFNADGTYEQWMKKSTRDGFKASTDLRSSGSYILEGDRLTLTQKRSEINGRTISETPQSTSGTLAWVSDDRFELRFKEITIKYTRRPN